MRISQFIHPGAIEIFTGVMAGGKSREMFIRFNEIIHVPGARGVIIKPSRDNRTDNAYTRFGETQFSSTPVPYDSPENIIKLVKPQSGRSIPNTVAIDDAHFFSDETNSHNDKLLETVLELSIMGVDVLVAGLDLDFRGEPYMNMQLLFPFATHNIYKGRAVCEYQGCGDRAIRTQRLFKGEPAHYNTPRLITGDEKGAGDSKDYTYKPRCLAHFFVPRD